MAGAAVRIGRIRPKPVCGNCRHFRRRDPAAAWPIAGVSATAEGKCFGPTLMPIPDAWRPWRRATDSCDRFAGRDNGREAGS